MDLIQNTPHLWLIIGAALILMEFVIVPGVGLVFAGMGALTIGIAIELGLTKDQTTAWVIFLAATILWAGLLWKPFSSFRTNKSAGFSDMVGHKAILITDIVPGEMGQAKWSGTIMNAKLEDTALSAISGTEVTITKVEKNVLFVK